MHKKLAMEQQIGRQLTSKDASYQRLLDKAVRSTLNNPLQRATGKIGG
jgi:hypothetical protein